MNRLVTALTILLLLSLSSAHAANYTFSDNNSFTVEEPSRGYHSNSLTPKLTTKTQNISNTTGTISDLNVTIHNINSAHFGDMNFILVGPNNTGVILSSHAGGHFSASNASLNNTTFTFDDEANKSIPIPKDSYEGSHLKVDSGSYLPTGGSGKPSPFLLWVDRKHEVNHLNRDLLVYKQGIKTSGLFREVDFAQTNRLSAFNDISANGSWRLLAFDNLTYILRSGHKFYGAQTLTTVSGGWSLDITTNSGAVPEPAEWILIGICICGIIALKLKPQMVGLRIFNK